MRMRWFENMMQPLRRLDGYRQMTRKERSWREVCRPGFRKTVWLRSHEIRPDDDVTGLYLPSLKKQRKGTKRVRGRKEAEQGKRNNLLPMLGT